MNMVERVAESQAKFDGRELIEMPRTERERYFQRARAAIEAMREPTDGMMHAGWMAQYASLGASEAEAKAMANSKILLEREKEFLRAGWSAALSAALKEPSK